MNPAVFGLHGIFFEAYLREWFPVIPVSRCVRKDIFEALKAATTLSASQYPDAYLTDGICNE
jgi:hypothetical protein